MASEGALGGGGRQNATNDNGAPLSLSLSVIKIVKHCGTGGRGGIGGVPTSYKTVAPPIPLFVNKIVKYWDVWVRGALGGGGRRQNPIKDNGDPSLCHLGTSVLWRWGKGGHWGSANVLQK